MNTRDHGIVDDDPMARWKVQACEYAEFTTGVGVEDLDCVEILRQLCDDSAILRLRLRLGSAEERSHLDDW